MNNDKFWNYLQLNDKKFTTLFANLWHKKMFMNLLQENKLIVVLLFKRLNYYISN